MRTHAFALVVAAACNLPRPPRVSSDGGADAAVVADASPNMVVGHSVITHVLPSGSVTMDNEDLSGYTVQAYVVDTNQPSGYTVVDGKGDATGVVTIDDVPAGATFALKLVPPQGPDDPTPIPKFYFTQLHDLDLGYVALGRAGTVPITHPTPVSVTMSNMTPWAKFGGALFADSFATDTAHEFWYATGTLNGPTQGATSLAQTTFDWSSDPDGQSPVAPRRIDAAAGDDLSIEHVQVVFVSDALGDTNNGFLHQLVDHAAISNVEMTDGAALPVTGTFSPVPTTQTQNFSFETTSLEAAVGCGGGSDFEAIAFERFASPASAYGIVAGAPLYGIGDTLTASVRGVSSVGFNNVHFGNPFPSTWGQIMTAHYECGRTLPDGTNTQSEVDVAQVPDPGHDFVQPYVGGATNVKVGGGSSNAGGALPFDGTHSVLVSWDAVNGSTQYEVDVVSSYVDPTDGPTLVTVATFATLETSVAIPPDVFTKGKLYSFNVISVRNPAGYAEGALRSSGFPWGQTSISTSAFRLSDTCGNGTVDAGEECDDGGDSATCDADCTKRSCGDGYKNSVAGELCDWGEPGPCDRDCTPVVCGDGYWNQSLEECDDGNTTDDGNGCSTQCTLNKCGDGKIQGPWEQCDDGNTTSGDGCSSRCQVEPT
jgi:cysteine-rich repeat protein